MEAMEDDSIQRRLRKKIRPVYAREGLDADKIGIGDVFDGFDIDVKSCSSDDVLVYMEAR